jgi:DNA-binding transcriptional regulator GbsR (MarR family)
MKNESQESYEEWLKEQNITKERIDSISSKVNDKKEDVDDRIFIHQELSKLTIELKEQKEVQKNIYKNVQFFFWLTIVSMIAYLIWTISIFL